MKTFLVSALALGLVTTGAMAQDAMSPTAPDFVTVDADKSGDVSLSEAQLVWPNLTAEAYAAADTDSSGSLSQAELEAYLAAQPAAQ